MTGTIYTETTIYSPPEAFAAEAPYQLAIVALEDGTRVTARIASQAGAEPVAIGDHVRLLEERHGIPFFEKA